MQPRGPLRVVPAPFWLGRRRSAGSVASRISPRWQCSWRQTNQPGSPGRSFVRQAGSLWPPEVACADLEHIRVKRGKGNRERRILSMQLQDNYFAANRSLKLTRDGDGVLVIEFHT